MEAKEYPSNIKLKKCPFCGGKAIFVNMIQPNTSTVLDVRIQCSVCGVKTRDAIIDTDFDHSNDNLMEVAKLWNTRSCNCKCKK